MDPVNLSGTQNAPSDCKSYAGIRSPAGCACCGLKDYPQNIPQAYCFTALCPGLSKCKSTQDHPQDNFAIPQAFFSSFPFQQHFFHNSIMPPNFCCSQKLVSDEGTSTCQMQSRNEHKTNQHQSDHHVPPQKERSDSSGTNKNNNEEAQKNNSGSGPETTSSYSNPTESQPNTVFQRCVCGDPVPWACRPLIVPVLSYCFLWNSQAAATSLFSKTYNAYVTETLCQKNFKKQENQKYSCPSHCQEQQHTLNQEPDKAACDKNHDSVEIPQECLEVNESSKIELKLEEQEESTEQGESTEQEEGTEQEENECMKNDSDGNYEEEEDESETGDDIEIRDQTESEESVKGDENDSPAADSSESLTKDLDYQDSPDTESCTNLKSPPKSSDHSLIDALSECQANLSETEVKHKNSSTATNEEYEEKNSDSEDPDTSRKILKEVVIKKCIKNFTVTHNINGAPSKEVQMSAAGDLGGECCGNCKIRASLEENNEEILKQPFKTGMVKEESEPNALLEGGERNVEGIQSSGHKFKSGIAKLSTNSNLKPQKLRSLKSIKKCKNYCSEKQSNAVRARHCCFPADNTNSKNENPPKAQKAKKCVVVQTPAPVSGPETPKKSLKTPKKVNTPRKPARPVNLAENSQKSVKTLLKK